MSGISTTNVCLEIPYRLKLKIRALFIYIAHQKTSAYSCRFFLLHLLSTPQQDHWYAATHLTSRKVSGRVDKNRVSGLWLSVANKYVLSSRLNNDTESADLMLDGRLFHARGPADANARSANDVIVRGMTRSQQRQNACCFLSQH